jgi:hypothetical protein
MNPSEEEKIRVLKSTLQNRKSVYETFCEVLAKYDCHDCAYGAIRFNDMYLEYFQNEQFSDFLASMFDVEDTEIGRLESNIKYLDKMIKMAEDRIDNLSHGLRVKIVKDFLSAKNNYFSVALYSMNKQGAESEGGAK